MYSQYSYMSHSSAYEIKIFTQKQILTLIKTDISLRNLLNSQRNEYLVTLSDKFKHSSIDNIVKNEKRYFLSTDDDAELFYMILYDMNNMRNPVGLCKFIVFSDKIKNIDFFDALRNSNYNLSHTMYIFGVYVMKNERGKGICNHMIKYLLTYMRDNNISIAVSDIKKSNTSSIKCFTKNNFIHSKIISRAPDIFFYLSVNSSAT